MRCVIVLRSIPREVFRGQAVCALSLTRDELTQNLGSDVRTTQCANDERFWRSSMSGQQAKSRRNTGSAG